MTREVLTREYSEQLLWLDYLILTRLMSLQTANNDACNVERQHILIIMHVMETLLWVSKAKTYQTKLHVFVDTEASESSH